jgi:hypothetical protein
MVIQAMETRRVKGIQIVPIGLIFERKDRPRSSIVAIVGDPIDADAVVDRASDPVGALTAAIDTALRSLTLNYTSVEAAERDARLARILHAVLRFDAPSLADGRAFQPRAELARLLPSFRQALLGETSETKNRALALEADLLAFDAELKTRRVSVDDFSIARSVGQGAVFVIREVLILLLAGPVALWGWLSHLVPFRAALLAGKRVKHSAADPAMRTIVAGAAFVLMMYMLQGAAVALIAGPWWGLAYVAILPIAADINLRTRDRLRRAFRRARAYLYFRARPAVQNELLRRAAHLRDEATALAKSPGVSPSS